ncbi:hypothetical protein [Rummeliibacillus pycnus]|uniref:ParM/StbA family protein n=1 Tax=Rummeliibacillus pycnus TaxID=101070 RepID=UPI003D2E9B13
MNNEGIEYISVDLGYGFVKAISSNGKRVIFPALIGEGYDGGLNMGNVIGFGNDKEFQDDDIQVQVDGKIYNIGNSASSTDNITRNFNKQDRFNAETTKILINVAIQLVSDNKCNKVYLLTGLPLDFYAAQSKNFAESMNGEQMAVKWLSGENKGETFKKEIVQTLVFPQGASAIMSATVNHEGRNLYADLMDQGNMFALIDVGFRTTDYIVVEVMKNGAFAPIIKLSGTYDKGVIDLRNALKMYFKGQTGGAELKDRLIDSKLLNKENPSKKITYNSEPIDFAPIINEKKSAIANDIADHLRQLWKDESSFFAKIFLAGGGGDLYEEWLKKNFKGLQKVNEYQFANAIGYLRMGKAILRKKEVV